MTEKRARVIATRLRVAREAKGLSQKEVADQLGYHRPTITNIEMLDRKVTALEILEFARLYDEDVLYLLGETDKKKKDIELTPIPNYETCIELDCGTWTTKKRELNNDQK